MSEITASAVSDFFQARRRASLEAIMARLTGKSVDLLSYEDVRQKLKASSSIERGLKDIPLDAIVGSVGRYTDFTRSFLPKRDSNIQRWTRVMTKASDLEGLPPVEVYQVGEAYFVRDGNHRVSVARQLGATHIQAYVTEVKTKVSLSSDIQPDDLILKAEFAHFLEQTRLDVLRPGSDLATTLPGRYRILKEHIDVHRYYMGLEQQRDISYEEAVTHWYDEVYMPVVRAVRQQGILRDFPQRTETDLYVWVSEHRSALEDELGWDISTQAAASDLVAQTSPRLWRILARLGEKVLGAVWPDELEAGPPTGEWRREYLSARQDKCDCLFADILIAVSGKEVGWHAVDQAIEVAKHEDAQLRGLHVISSEEHRDSDEVQAIEAEFYQRCEGAGVQGRLAIAVDGTANAICSRARWTDLVVANLVFPPPLQPWARVGSGFRTLIRRCPRPILAVPSASYPLEHALLAYDGSPKGKEALFVATYLAYQWHVPLTVVTVIESGRTNQATLEKAQDYLTKHKVEANLLQKSGEVAKTILKVAEEEKCDLIIMGGYGLTPLLEVVLGSTVDHILRAGKRPVLICR